jgi:hypothetical protein
MSGPRRAEVEPAARGRRAGAACLWLALIATTAGCASGPCTGDPRTDDLACASQGVFSGGYQQRVAERQAIADERQQQARYLRAENQSLEAQIASLNSRIAAQRQELNRLGSALQQASAQGQLTPAEAAIRQAQLDRLNRQQQALQQSKAQTAELQKKADALQKEIDDLKASLARRVL